MVGLGEQLNRWRKVLSLQVTVGSSCGLKDLFLRHVIRQAAYDTLYGR
jgi:hypothetical protein